MNKQTNKQTNIANGIPSMAITMQTSYDKRLFTHSREELENLENYLSFRTKNIHLTKISNCKGGGQGLSWESLW